MAIVRTKIPGAKRYWQRNKWDIIFYSFMVLWPLAQFCVFYIGVNFRSLLLAFQEINNANQTVTWTFETIKKAFRIMTSDIESKYIFGNSWKAYFVSLFVGIPLGLFFSFYIYKKSFISNFFRVLLFLPSIISGIIMVTMFKYFSCGFIPELFKRLGICIEGMEDGLIDMKDLQVPVIYFFYVFVSFGTSVLMYSNAMSGISKDVIESVHIDGATGFREFIFITLPMIFPTISTFLITGIAGIFNNQVNLFSFYGRHAPSTLATFGYYIFVETEQAASDSDYTVLAAMGILMTCIAVPLTFLVKWALEKFGPSED